MKKIKWHETTQHMKKELVSSDNRWHISLTQDGENPPSVFLSNYDLLLTPHGTGTSCRECFERFIEECDLFIEKVEAAKLEALEHLQNLLANTHPELEVLRPALNCKDNPEDNHEN